MTLLLFFLAGCGGEGVMTDYGWRESLRGGDASVNGLGVLSEMFDAAGHDVNGTTTLTPRLGQETEVFVWFCHDFFQPSAQAKKWMESWLRNQSGRTLVFVCRDWDAAPFYWSKVAAQAPAGQRANAATEAAAARGQFLAERNALPAQPTDWDWFTIDGKRDYRKITTLAGDPDWTAGVNPANLEIELWGHVTASDDNAELLLTSGSGKDILAMRRRVGASQMIVVANGSFLLNAALVNREHRKLAGALIDEVGPPAKDVVFLQTGGSPRIMDKDPEFKQTGILALLQTPPLSYLLNHLLLVALLVCFWRWPIFGLRREEDPPPRSQFGHHVTALGKLLAATRAEAYARERIHHYQQMSESARHGE